MKLLNKYTKYFLNLIIYLLPYSKIYLIKLKQIIKYNYIIFIFFILLLNNIKYYSFYIFI